ncbi:MAG TPA: disulfide bond formation protein B, partial [Rhizomicrobium sp.]|nr:disulfide bond formation protein B [Rhizomicrobium sp.]
MIRDEQVARLMGAGALALFLGALGFQYLVHLAPCEMCHWQRAPHVAAAITGLVLISVPRQNKHILAWLAVVFV